VILADTNIFLEILLNQKAKERCKTFLNTHIGNLAISDFSLHSLGIILFKEGKQKVFNQFLKDILPYVLVYSLSKPSYSVLSEVSASSGLDFDDAYQCSLSSENSFEIATMDKDFKKAPNKIKVHFI
jgi:predicted nucleic acid-binding protein